MTALEKQDSNRTSMYWAEETTIGVLPGSPVWNPLEPNEYNDFGGKYTLVARNPINAGRQKRKGVITDLDVSGGVSQDLTQVGMQELMQGFFFADFHRKGEEAVTAVDLDTTNPDRYHVASTTGFVAGYLIFGSGFTNAANNGLHVVDSITSDTYVKTATGELVAEASPPAAAKIVVVGVQGGAGDIDVVNAGGVTLPGLTSTTLDFTSLGLSPGEWIFIGAASHEFAAAANNGFARIYSIAAHLLTFDKTQFTMSAVNDTTNTIRLFFGRFLKNEADFDNQVRRTYQLERQLGPDDDTPGTDQQAEYLVGAVADQAEFTFKTASIITAKLDFVGIDYETVTSSTGPKTGTRSTLVSGDAYNATNDFARIKLAVLNRTGGANPTALFGHMTDVTLSLKNNAKPDKALATLGAFDMTVGQFEITGKATAYFANVTALAAIPDNSDVTLDAILVKNNVGIAIDVPLIALGDGRLKIAQDEPIMLDLDMPAAADSVFDHTMSFTFFDYLPDLAG
jgi:hypothetical protein